MAVHSKHHNNWNRFILFPSHLSLICLYNHIWKRWHFQTHALPSSALSKNYSLFFGAPVQMFLLPLPLFLQNVWMAVSLCFLWHGNSTGSCFPGLKINLLYFEWLLIEQTQFSLHKLKNKSVSTKGKKHSFLSHFIPFKRSSTFSSNLKNLTQKHEKMSTL